MEVPLRGWRFSIYMQYIAQTHVWWVPVVITPCLERWFSSPARPRVKDHTTPIHERATLDNAGTRPKPWQVYKYLEFSPTQSSPNMKIIAIVNHCDLKDREDHREQPERCWEANWEERESRAGGCEEIQEPPIRKARARAVDAPRTRTKVTENKKYQNNSKKRRDSAEINMSHKNHREPWRSNKDQPRSTKLQKKTIPSQHQNNENNWEAPPELYREPPKLLRTNKHWDVVCLRERSWSDTWLLLALLMLLKISLIDVMWRSTAGSKGSVRDLCDFWMSRGFVDGSGRVLRQTNSKLIWLWYHVRTDAQIQI